MGNAHGSDRAVAVGLLTRADLDTLGAGFRRAYPLKQHIDLDQPIDFEALLNAIDKAEANAPSGSS